jgi:hypothetical protein
LTVNANAVVIADFGSSVEIQGNQSKAGFLFYTNIIKGLHILKYKTCPMMKPLLPFLYTPGGQQRS